VSLLRSALSIIRRHVKKCRGLWPILAMLLVVATVFYPVMRGHAFGAVGRMMLACFPWAQLDQGWKAEVYGINFPQSDAGSTYFPHSVFLTDALRSGQFPLWNPYSFAGQPVYELGMLGISYPPHIVLALLFDPIWQLQIFLAVHLFLAIAGMYLFLRRQRLSKAGALLGGIVWALNGFTIFWLLFEHTIAITALVPWILLALREAVARRSHWIAAVAGLLLGTLLHVGHLMLIYIWEIGAAIFAVWLIVREMRNAPFRTLRGSGHLISIPVCMGLVALAVGAPIWLPVFDWQPLMARVPMTLEQQLREASELTPLSDLVRALALHARASFEIPFNQILNFASFLFIGAVPLLFVPLGILFAGRRGIALTGIIALLLACSVGASWLVVPLNRFVPFFGAIHVYNFMHPALFCAAMLAAYGVTGAQRLLAGSGDRRPSPAWWMTLGAGLFALHMAQMVGYLWAITPTNSIRQEWLYPPTPGIELARQMQGEFHVMPVINRLTMLEGRTSAVFGLRSIGGYESLMPIYSRHIWRAVENGGEIRAPLSATTGAFFPFFMDKRLDLHVLQVLSIGWLLAAPDAKPSEPGGADLIASGGVALLYDGPDTRLMQVKDALPRAFLSAAVEKIDDPDAALAAVLEPQFDPRQKVIVSGTVDPNLQPFLNAAPQANHAAPGTARIVIDLLNRVAVEVDTPRAAILQLNDTWAPGWKATVDGRPARVHRSNLAFRAVAVPAGRSLVLFSYRPASVLIGMALAGVGVAFTGILLLGQLVSVRRKRATLSPS